jgi:NTE family protein
VFARSRAGDDSRRQDVRVFHFLRSADGDQAWTGRTHRGAARGPSIGLALGGGAARGFAHIGVIRTLLAKGLTRHHHRHLDRRGRRRLLCGRQARRDRGLGRSLTRRSLLAISMSASAARPAQRRQAAEKIAEASATHDRQACRALRRDRDRDRHRPRDLDHARRLADALRASYALPGSFRRCARRPLAGRRRAGQSGAGIGRARARRATRDRGQRQHRLFGRGTTIPDQGRRTEPPIEEEVASRGLFGLFGAEKNAKRRFSAPRRPGLSNVMVEAFNIMQDRITRARLAGDPPDVMISPRVGRVGLFDFHRAQEAITSAPRRRARARRFDEVVARWRSRTIAESVGYRVFDQSCRTNTYAVAMYSRSASALASISSTRHFTTSPIEITPTSWPCSTTGRWRNLPVGHPLHDDRDRVGSRCRS